LFYTFEVASNHYYFVLLINNSVHFDMIMPGNFNSHRHIYMRWNGLLAGFEARSRRVRFPLGAPNFFAALADVVIATV